MESILPFILIAAFAAVAYVVRNRIGGWEHDWILSLLVALAFIGHAITISDNPPADLAFAFAFAVDASYRKNRKSQSSSLAAS